MEIFYGFFEHCFWFCCLSFDFFSRWFWNLLNRNVGTCLLAWNVGILSSTNQVNSYIFCVTKLWLVNHIVFAAIIQFEAFAKVQRCRPALFCLLPNEMKQSAGRKRAEMTTFCLQLIVWCHYISGGDYWPLVAVIALASLDVAVATGKCIYRNENVPQSGAPIWGDWVRHGYVIGRFPNSWKVPRRRRHTQLAPLN